MYTTLFLVYVIFLALLSNSRSADLLKKTPKGLLRSAPTLYLEFGANDVVCPPAPRPAVLLLIGMLAAPGISILRNVYSINRGYEDLADRLNSLGAHIEIINEI